jgi:hypothetical protein
LCSLLEFNADASFHRSVDHIEKEAPGLEREFVRVPQAYFRRTYDNINEYLRLAVAPLMWMISRPANISFAFHRPHLSTDLREHAPLVKQAQNVRRFCLSHDGSDMDTRTEVLVDDSLDPTVWRLINKHYATAVKKWDPVVNADAGVPFPPAGMRLPAEPTRRMSDTCLNCSAPNCGKIKRCTVSAVDRAPIML